MSGNTRILVNIAGTITDAWGYQAFGDKTRLSGTLYNPFTFVGQFGVFDDTSNQCYMRQRMMFASKGGVLLRDPIGFRGRDWNLYRYVGNNPLTRVDPSGYGFLACAVICCILMTEVCSDCAELCNGANDLQELRKILNGVMKRRKNCTDPKSVDDCMNCAGNKNTNKNNCKQCCEKLYPDCADSKKADDCLEKCGA